MRSQRLKIRCLTLLLFFSVAPLVNAQVNSINRNIEFGGDHIIYKGNKIALGAKAFFIDGQLSDAQIKKHKYVYNSINEASKHLTNGTEEAPMVLYIAPWVYWIDNPDDPAIRMPKEIGSSPIGLEIKCEWLTFQGLSDNPEHIILASNRGQTMGSKGNFTMFRISGDGTLAENVTFGNYCNIDLIYPLNPKLNREKRGSAIVQAQLIFSNGDKVVARNTHFISRLNLGPFWGSKRTLFDRCHFELTDDALNGTAVYLNCTLDFYSSKPFYRTNGTGAVFLNSDIRVFTRGNQYFEKAKGQVAVVDTRFTAENLTYVGWCDIPDLEIPNYQYNVRLNGKNIRISDDHPGTTVDMMGRDILNAYRFDYKGNTVYNTYNLLRGNDDWDPMGVKSNVENAERESGKNYSTVPTQLVIKPTQKKLETGKDSLQLEATVYRFGNYETSGVEITWSILPEYKSLVELKPLANGKCLVIPTNTNNETKEVLITVSTSAGLVASSTLYIAPSFLEPPAFVRVPEIKKQPAGLLELSYDLDMPFEDESLITWYRCKDAQGTSPIEVAVSRFNTPMKKYTLTSGDVGYYIMAQVSPKHMRCNPGPKKKVVFRKVISGKDVKASAEIFIPNLENMSGKYQPQVLPGFWSLDSYAPVDTQEFNWEADNTVDPWYFGAGINGAASDSGFVQNVKGARMRYTPVGKFFGDMKISFTAITAKTAGQGFSSARAQYMDIGIKMDNAKMNGYALRLIRTTKFSDAIDFILMEYKNGIATPISKPVSATCYRPNCLITIEVSNNKIIVHAENTQDYFSESKADVVKVVDMQTAITTNTFGGVSFQHTGTVDGGATLIKDLKIEWFK